MSRSRSRASVGWRGRIRARCGPRLSERGAVLVEAAFVFPVFLLMLFGMIEFGFIFKDSLTLSQMAQAGVRTGAAAGNNSQPNADYQILSAIKASSGPLAATIDGVIIFQADGTNEDLPANCSISTPSAGCNVYSKADLENLQPTWAAETANDPCAFNCPGAPDEHWPVGTRIVQQSGNNGAGPDYLGVFIVASHSTLTGFIPSVTLHDTAVMRLEPQQL